MEEERVLLRERIALRRGYAWYYSAALNWYYILPVARVESPRERRHLYPITPYADLVRVPQPERGRCASNLPTVPDYFESWEEAQKVLNELRAGGYYCHLHFPTAGGCVFEVFSKIGALWHWSIEEAGGGGPEAIFRAWLKLVEREGQGVDDQKRVDELALLRARLQGYQAAVSTFRAELTELREFRRGVMKRRRAIKRIVFILYCLLVVLICLLLIMANRPDLLAWVSG